MLCSGASICRIRKSSRCSRLFVSQGGSTLSEIMHALWAEILPVFGWPGAIEALTHQAPFIAMIDLASLYGTTPMFQWHFVVPLTLHNDVVQFYDPADGPDRRVPRDDFLAAWATAGYRGVRVWIP